MFESLVAVKSEARGNTPNNVCVEQMRQLANKIILH